MFDTFRAIIDAWPTDMDLAADCMVERVQITDWRRRDTIPSAYWDYLVAAAPGRKINGIDLDLLCRLTRDRHPTARRVQAV